MLLVYDQHTLSLQHTTFEGKQKNIAPSLLTYSLTAFPPRHARQNPSPLTATAHFHSIHQITCSPTTRKASGRSQCSPPSNPSSFSHNSHPSANNHSNMIIHILAIPPQKPRSHNNHPLPQYSRDTHTHSSPHTGPVLPSLPSRTPSHSLLSPGFPSDQ